MASRANGRRSRVQPVHQTPVHAAAVAGIRSPKPHPYRYSGVAPLIPSEESARAHGWRPSDGSGAAVVARGPLEYDQSSPFATVRRRLRAPTLSQAIVVKADGTPQQLANVAPLRAAVTRDAAFIPPAIVTSPPTAGRPGPSALPTDGVGVRIARTARPGVPDDLIKPAKRQAPKERDVKYAGLPTRDEESK